MPNQKVDLWLFFAVLSWHLGTFLSMGHLGETAGTFEIKRYLLVYIVCIWGRCIWPYLCLVFSYWCVVLNSAMFSGSATVVRMGVVSARVLISTPEFSKHEGRHLCRTWAFEIDIGTGKTRSWLLRPSMMVVAAKGGSFGI